MSSISESPALRLARYLKEFVGLRTTTVRDVANYDTVLWFGGMPQEEDCRSGAWADGLDPSDPWLEVKKQEFEPPPSPPDIVIPWIDAQAFKRATETVPALRQSILCVNEEVELADGESPPLIETTLEDHPDVRAAYDEYLPNWEDWSKEYRRREAIQKVYADLFHLHTQVRKQGEIVEIVLGLGLLEWRAKLNGHELSIRRHVAVTRVELEFEEVGEICRQSKATYMTLPDVFRHGLSSNGAYFSTQSFDT